MTEDQLQRIERTLSLTLPQDYREAVLNYAFPQDIEDELYDDVDRIIEDNLKYRSDGFSGLGWPAHFFAFGGDHEDNCYYFDLLVSPPPVFFADRETGATELEIDTFAEWLEYARQAQAEYEEDLAEEQAEAEAEEAAARAAENAVNARQLEYPQLTNTKQWWQFWK